MKVDDLFFVTISGRITIYSESHNYDLISGQYVSPYTDILNPIPITTFTKNDFVTTEELYEILDKYSEDYTVLTLLNNKKHFS